MTAAEMRTQGLRRRWRRDGGVTSPRRLAAPSPDPELYRSTRIALRQDRL